MKRNKGRVECFLDLGTAKSSAGISPNAGLSPTGKWVCRLTAQLAVVCLVLIGSPSVAHCQTFVSGNVSGSWTKQSSPYIVVGNCTVPSGQSLVINPGVEVRIGKGLQIDVSGQISAVGTPTEPISIRGSAASNYWNRIAVLYSGNPNSTFANCRFSDATNALFFSINASGTLDPRVLNCTFSNCVESCIYGYATAPARQDSLKIGTLNGTIANCRFHGSTKGVYVEIIGQAPPYGYEYSGQGTASPKVVNNLFEGISDTAVEFYVGPLRTTTAPANPKVLNNVIDSCTVGIERSGDLRAYSDAITYNCFYNNVGGDFLGYPAGVYGVICCANGNGTPCDVAYNIFQNPQYGESTTYTFAAGSPCVDAGNPAGAYLDTCVATAVGQPGALGTPINDMGHYGGPNGCEWVSITSTNFILAAQKFVGVTIFPGVPGRYRLEYTASVGSQSWTQLTNVLLQTSPFTYIDYDYPAVGKRFYRGVMYP